MPIVCHRLKVWKSLCRGWAYTAREHKECGKEHEICLPPKDYKEDRR